jgi:hypothetical protein
MINGELKKSVKYLGFNEELNKRNEPYVHVALTS